MSDFYSTMVAYDCIPCSQDDFNDLKHVLMTEMKRLEAEDLSFCLEVEYTDGEMFIFSEDSSHIDLELIERWEEILRSLIGEKDELF